MPLITEHTDSLPYIDRPLTPSSLASATTQISTERSSQPQPHDHPHPLLPPSPTPSFTPLIQSELTRIAAGTPLTGIDLSRYEGASPGEEDPTSTTSSSTASALKAAYTNSTYLSHRHETLSLLEQFGKNAWLVGNSQLEDILRMLERELVGVREEVEAVNRARKEGQERGRGELEGGEREWREGVRGVVEVQVALRGVEEGIREALRGGAGRR